MDHLCYFCIVLLCFHARLFVDRKGQASWLLFVMSNCDVVTFPQVWCLIVSIPDLCPLSYSNSLSPNRLGNAQAQT